MDLIVKHFNELSTTELYEILKTRFEIFVTEQECIYQDLDDKDQDAIHIFCWNDTGRVAGGLLVFWKDHDEATGVAQIGRVVTLEHLIILIVPEIQIIFHQDQDVQGSCALSLQCC